VNRKYTEDSLQRAVSGSTKWADVCAYFGVQSVGGNHGHFKARCVKYGIDFAHFEHVSKRHGGWNAGKICGPKQPIEALLRYGAVSSARLRRRLIAEGLKIARCERCGIDEWLGEPVRLELDHIDSDHLNNALVNLQMLCGNCHNAKTFHTRMARKKRR